MEPDRGQVAGVADHRDHLAAAQLPAGGDQRLEQRAPDPVPARVALLAAISGRGGASSDGGSLPCKGPHDIAICRRCPSGLEREAGTGFRPKSGAAPATVGGEPRSDVSHWVPRAREGGSRRRAASQETCRRLDHPYEPGGVHRRRQRCATDPIPSPRDPDPFGPDRRLPGASARPTRGLTTRRARDLPRLAGHPRPGARPGQAAALLLARPGSGCGRATRRRAAAGAPARHDPLAAAGGRRLHRGPTPHAERA